MRGRLEAKSVENDLRVLKTFVRVYCRKQHASGNGGLCGDCRALLDYAEERLRKCPLDPKPKCKDCLVHCYNDEYRRQIRKVMKVSGTHFVKRGRVDWLFRYFLR